MLCKYLIKYVPLIQISTHKNNFAVLCIAVIALGIFSGCNPRNRTQRGAAIGAGAGITVGTVIGKTAGNVALGAIIGGAVGGTAGAYIAHKMDNTLGDNFKNTIPGAKTVRRGDTTFLKFDSAILFDQGSTDIKPEGQTDVKNLAAALQTNLQTNISIIGHTDSLGTVDYNIDLSKKRAQAIKDLLISDGVKDDRLTAIGKGAAEPVGDNKTEEGRAKNRRIVVVILPNGDLKASTTKSSQ
jgi:outer membrane protein OmpA-like peptidoglycan-associated protein